MRGMAPNLVGLALVAGYGCAGPEARGVEMNARDSQLGQQVEIAGEAQNAKGGAVILTDGNEPIYVRGLERWHTELEGQRLEVAGTLYRREGLASPAAEGGQEVASGIEGEQRYLDAAPAWKKTLGRITVVTGTARNAGAGPVIVTPIGPLYVHEAGERWPNEVVGKTVTGVGRLMRNKRPVTQENDDSEFGGRPELTEEWALRHSAWFVE